ncbi:C-module-binding factor A-like [Toxorhynchites rutilus septentrionalis]|uniref:C-module-binding factor A-like n=1 Tax=Toxorhynchites rutilus septentrionalis TaxID=329112 RepID=UPI0024795F71|nr:C-module-binding factor A-like [Toxorhynchites rutilus septentrionalis]
MASSSSGPPGGRATNRYRGRPTQRTSPFWADPLSGDLEILLLRATGEDTLPSNPFLVSKTVAKAGSLESARPQRDDKNRIQYVLSVREKDVIENLLSINKLIDNTPIEIIYHPTLNQRKCVVTCREVLDLKEDELLKELADQKVIEVKRITRKENDLIIATPTLILTIRGTVVPEYINFGFLRAGTRNYYPNPMQCFKCYRFGHTTKRCRRNTPLCKNCGKEHKINISGNKICKSPELCVNCKGDHTSSNRTCPIWVRENNITRIRVDEGISHNEARKKYDLQNNGITYSSVLQDRLNTIQTTVDGCTQCKCQCNSARPNQDNSQSITSGNETESSVDESEEDSEESEEEEMEVPKNIESEEDRQDMQTEEESDNPMEYIEIRNKNKRKISNKGISSEEHKSSDEENKQTKEVQRKRTRNEQTNQINGRNNTHTHTNNKHPHNNNQQSHANTLYHSTPNKNNTNTNNTHTRKVSSPPKGNNKNK